MGMKLCPTCKRKMMDTFIICPWCKTDFSKTKEEPIISSQNAPISNIEYHEGKKTKLIANNGNSFLFEISDNWDLSDSNKFLSSNQKDELYKILSNIDFLQRISPALYDTIKVMSKEDNVLIAKLDQYTKKLVDEGKLWFSVDKNGELLPTVRNNKGIVKQVRLEKWIKPTSGFSEPLTNVYTQMALTRILNEVTSLKSSISSIKADLQQDRLAKADRAISLYRQAMACTSARKDELLKTASYVATDAKTTLMNNLKIRLDYIVKNVDKTWVEKLIDTEGDAKLEESATDAVNDLVGILQMLDIECTVHRYYGEDAAINECLQEYLSFIQANRLDQRDTLLRVTECLPAQLSSFINSYSKLVSNISLYQRSNVTEQSDYEKKLLTSLIQSSTPKTCSNCNCELPSDSRNTTCEFCSRSNNKDIKKMGKMAGTALSVIGGISLGAAAFGKK